MSEDTCDVCGAKLQIGGGPGEWCKGDPKYHEPGEFGRGLYEAFDSYVDSDILPRTDPRVQYHNGWGRPGVLIESRSDRKKLMKERGLGFGGCKEF